MDHDGFKWEGQKKISEEFDYGLEHKYHLPPRNQIGGVFKGDDY